MSSPILRSDGRRKDEIRSCTASFGLIDNCDGSVLLTQGLTKVLAIVGGPKEANRSSTLHDKAAIRCVLSQAAFSSSERLRRHPNDSRLIHIARFVEETFSSVISTKQFPGLQIEIVLTILQSDGSILPVCINAACLALTHAGIPLVDLVFCCSAGLSDSDIIIDLNYLEEARRAPRIAMTLMPRSGRILSLKMENSSGRTECSVIDELMEKAESGCDLMHKKLGEQVRDFLAQ